jgi:hypothetical protein
MAGSGVGLSSRKSVLIHWGRKNQMVHVVLLEFWFEQPNCKNGSVRLLVLQCWESNPKP